MIPGDIAHDIGRYIEHLGDGVGNGRGWVESLVRRWGRPALATALFQMFDSREPQLMDDAALFVGDLHHTAPSLEAHLSMAGLGRHLGVLLVADDWRARNAARNALHDSSRLGVVRHFRAALPWYVERRPMEVPEVLRELVWHDGPRAWRHHRIVLNARSFVARWSIVRAVESAEGRRGSRARRYASICRRLTRDVSPLVRIEARSRLDAHRRIRLVLARPKAERRHWHVRREIERARPRVTFHDVWLSFANWCHVMRIRDYDVRTAEAFVAYVARRTIREHLEEHPGPVDDALNAYYRAFVP